jgi:hypothetical protein
VEVLTWAADWRDKFVQASASTGMIRATEARHRPAMDKRPYIAATDSKMDALPALSPDRWRLFSWRRGLLHAFAPTAIIISVMVCRVVSGSVPYSPLLAHGVTHFAGQAFFAGLALSFLFQTRRKVAAWTMVVAIVALFATGVARGLAGAGWTASGGEASEALRPPGSWEYRLSEHGFSLTLPSESWHQAKNRTHIADFAANPHGAGMLAAVSAVEPETREEFEKSVATFKTTLTSDVHNADKPKIQEGNTPSGDPYIFGSVGQKVGEKSIYFAGSRTWLKDRGITVTILFEGHRAYLSKIAEELETQGFEQAAQVICLSVKPFAEKPPTAGMQGVDSVAALSSSRVAHESPASDGSAGAGKVARGARPKFRFDWAPPCRVPVIDTSKQRGKTVRTRYTVALRAASGKNLRVGLEDFAFLEFDGQNITGPEWQKRLGPMLALVSAIPDFEVSRRGEYQKCDGLQQWLDRFIIEQRMTLERAEEVRKMMASPSIAAASQAAVHGYWANWVEAWLEWDLLPGESKEERDELTLPTGARVPSMLRRQFLRNEDGYATVQQIRTISGAAVGGLITPFVKEIAQQVGTTPPAQLVADGQIVTTIFAEIEPHTLRPRSTRSLVKQWMVFPNGSKSSQEESRDLQWDWDHAEGCGVRAPADH